MSHPEDEDEMIKLLQQEAARQWLRRDLAERVCDTDETPPFRPALLSEEQDDPANQGRTGS